MRHNSTYNLFSDRTPRSPQWNHLVVQTSGSGPNSRIGMRHQESEIRASLDNRLQWPSNMAIDAQSNGAGGVRGNDAAAAEDSCDIAPSRKYLMSEMRMAFAGTGGLLTVGELADGDNPDSRAKFALIAKGIAAREIIGFMWQSEPWVPMFQFEMGSRLLARPALQPLFKLLAPLYDAWEMANWFARPNQWLSGLRPVDQCARHLEAVLDVAHLEHFIATGQTAQ